MNGVKDPEILNLIKSQLSDWSDVSDESISAEFKMKLDKRAIKKILSSYGYFDANITAKRTRSNVTFNITLNDRYKFDDVLLIYVDQRKYRSGLTVGQVFDLIGIQYDSYTDTKQISEGGEKIADFFRDKGYAFVNVQDPEIQIDKGKKKIKSVYKIELKGKTIIDRTVINIKSKKDPKLIRPFIENRISWNNGSVYDRQKINALKDDLMSSRIFANISAKLSQPTLDPKDPTVVHTEITLDIEEALLRDISAGLKYGTNEKFGILLSWTHYNIDGKGSSVSTTIDSAKKDRHIALKHETPDIFLAKQKLASQVFYTKEAVTAYDVSKVGAESMLWQTFGQKCKVGIGICVEKSKTADKISDDTTKFDAWGIPIGLSFDTTDEYLDPQKGIRCQAVVTPYMGNLTNLTVFTGKASIYIPFKKNDFSNFVVLAIYSKYGSIFRKKSNKIPRDKLFFSGGANSVRGYDYQKLGPVNDNKKPLGGESVFEIGVEPRFRVSENLGLVAFLEFGNVYSKKIPNLLQKLFCGYGLGVRYYTPFGPIRLDIALPSKIRKNTNGKRIDSLFNIYISVGQAF